MPDYDPKSIPILDDVITNDDNENNATENRKQPFIAKSSDQDTGEVETVADENNLDLFSTGTESYHAEEQAFTEPVEAQPEPDIGSVDVIIDEISGNGPADESVEITEERKQPAIDSALIDYEADNESIDTLSSADSPPAEKFLADEPPEAAHFENRNDETEPLTPVSATTDTAISIESLADDIVKQLMPDLERQLHHLVRQALEEKMPQAITPPTVPSKSIIDE